MQVFSESLSPLNKEAINLEIKTSPSRNEQHLEQSPTREGSIDSGDEENVSRLTEDEPAPRSAPSPYDLAKKPQKEEVRQSTDMQQNDNDYILSASLSK